MSKLSYIEKLLDGAEVVWLPLGEAGTFSRGNGLQKKDFNDSGVGCIHYGQIYTHYGIAAEQTKTFVSEDVFKKAKKAKKGDLIIADTSENDEDLCKAVAWLGDEEIAISNHTFIYTHSLNPKYVSYFLQTEMFHKQKRPFITGAKVRSISAGNMAKIEIPIPCPNDPSRSLEIQAEIVRVLDAFTSLTTELTAELTARKKQYNYYRDQLLTFDGAGVAWKPLGEVCEKISSGKNKDKSNEGLYPVYGSTGVIGRTDNKAYEEDLLLVARVGANAGRVNIATGEYDVSDNTLILFTNDNINQKYVYYYLINLNLNRFTKGAGQPLLTAGQLKAMTIPVPTPEEQTRIVSILDKFDALTNSIQEGLPREIELRQKQYEYYRNQLLTFSDAELP